MVTRARRRILIEPDENYCWPKLRNNKSVLLRNNNNKAARNIDSTKRRRKKWVVDSVVGPNWMPKMKNKKVSQGGRRQEKKKRGIDICMRYITVILFFF